jgi:hypothetical protein
VRPVSVDHNYRRLKYRLAFRVLPKCVVVISGDIRNPEVVSTVCHILVKHGRLVETVGAAR